MNHGHQLGGKLGAVFGIIPPQLITQVLVVEPIMIWLVEPIVEAANIIEVHTDINNPRQIYVIIIDQARIAAAGIVAERTGIQESGIDLPFLFQPLEYRQLMVEECIGN